MDLNLKLTVEQVNAILEALGSAPYRTSAPVVAAIQMQAQAQMQEVAAKQAAENEARARHATPPMAASAVRGVMTNVEELRPHDPN